ncbi:MAG: Ig-like domain-containing protein [Gemmatimonadaceae bacterium]|nr:Ig-like domain-containing protein [Gemmatimonadaceae bacterium]
MRSSLPLQISSSVRVSGSIHRRPLFQAIRSLAVISAVLWTTACKSGEAAGPGPTPTAVRVQAGNQQTGMAGAALTTTLQVVVTDASNNPVANRRVDWDVGPGSGSVTPATTTTNNRGEASTVWTLGTVAGTARVTAQVAGVNPAIFTATVLPAAAATVVATPDVAFVGVGDTLRIRTSVRDQYGNDVPNQVINLASLDASIASIDANGLLTALTTGTTRVVASSGGRADTVPVTVGVAGSGVCGTLTPRTLGVGEVYIPTAAGSAVRECLVSPAGVNAEYALALISTATSFGTSSTVDVLGLGTISPLAVSLTAFGAEPAAAVLETVPEAQTEAADVAWQSELDRRTSERRELTPLAESARAWYADRQDRSQFRASAVAEAKVGDVLRLNVNANNACSNADMRNARVAAVGTRALIASDNDNPTGGYTDAEYQSILATFDTLVYPLDTTAFGAPSNISQYGKIILLYTRAVNALTPSGASFTIGGFFYARDLYPKTARNNVPACAASNENEMFYLLTPDPNGSVNSNRRTKDEVTLLNLNTIAHELQHLINSSRRLYVNTGAALNEQTWLDEGLSHIAEELLYLRVSGFTTRQNLNLTDVGGSTLRSDQFRNYASQNFSRFFNFLIAPETNSPYAPNDSLATRGATWNFLRFAAGRHGASGESAFLRALVNSPTTGVANLQGVLSGGQFADYLRDWAVSLIADDFSTATTAALSTSYINPTWNFRSIFPGLRFGSGAALGVYPIAARSLTSSAPQRIRLAGGTSSYVRFAIPSGQRAVVSAGSNGGEPANVLRYSLVRLR